MVDIASDTAPAEPASPARVSTAGQMLRPVLGLTAIVTSLVAFPAFLSWVVGFWLLVFTWTLNYHARFAWAPLLLLVAVLGVKGIPFIPLLLACLGSWAVAATVLGFYALRTRTSLSFPEKAVLQLMVWLAGAIWLWQWEAATSASKRSALRLGAPVVCLGDSLTAGMSRGGGYPLKLQEHLAVPVINFGKSGGDTQWALKVLPKVVDLKPQTVILEVGGHDFLKGWSRSATKESLTRIIAHLRAAGAEVVLMEVPRGFIHDGYFGLERQLAYEFDLELISDSTIRKFVLWSPHAPPGMWLKQHQLSEDGLHPNQRGDDMLAAEVADALYNVYGPEVLYRSP